MTAPIDHGFYVYVHFPMPHNAAGAVGCRVNALDPAALEGVDNTVLAVVNALLSQAQQTVSRKLHGPFPPPFGWEDGPGPVQPPAPTPTPAPDLPCGDEWDSADGSHVDKLIEKENNGE